METKDDIRTKIYCSLYRQEEKWIIRTITAKQITPGLMECLEDKRSLVRREAVIALGQKWLDIAKDLSLTKEETPEAIEVWRILFNRVIPALADVETSETENAGVKKAAEEALEKIRPFSSSVVKCFQVRSILLKKKSAKKTN